jgi:prepilin-type N-terminal cleavage/methylation domain-containing protein
MSVGRDQRGFTLIELMVAATVGIIVLLVAFALLDASSKSYGQIDARLDSTQRARRAMDWFEREIRSQACPDPSTPAVPALMQATDTSMTFWVNTAGSTATAPPLGTPITTFTPAQHRLELTAGKLVDSTLSGTFPNQTVASAKTLATNIGAVSGVPLFRYYAWKAGSGGTPTLPDTVPLTTPLSAADLQRVVKISISFAALPAKYTTSAFMKTVVNDDVFVRTADPSQLTGPKCAG